MPNIDEVAITTNGVLLAEHAQNLKNAGVKRLNVSLDSLKPKTFSEITRGGSLNTVLTGLNTAEAIGLKIKLNVVVIKEVNDQGNKKIRAHVRIFVLIVETAGLK